MYGLWYSNVNFIDPYVHFSEPKVWIEADNGGVGDEFGKWDKEI